MSDETRSPISQAIRPENTVKALSDYRRSHGYGNDQYAVMVQGFYDLMTDFYEFGYGEAFHFAPIYDNMTMLENIAEYERGIAKTLQAKPGMTILVCVVTVVL